MSTATPMTDMDRAEYYCARNRTYGMTPRQRRRFGHKQDAATGRRLAQLIADDPAVTLCTHHVREYCIGCLMCRQCDGCGC